MSGIAESRGYVLNPIHARLKHSRRDEGTPKRRRGVDYFSSMQCLLDLRRSAARAALLDTGISK